MLIMPVLQFEAVFHYMKKLMERLWKSKDVPNDFIFLVLFPEVCAWFIVFRCNSKALTYANFTRRTGAIPPPPPCNPNLTKITRSSTNRLTQEWGSQNFARLYISYRTHIHTHSYTYNTHTHHGSPVFSNQYKLVVAEHTIFSNLSLYEKYVSIDSTYSSMHSNEEWEIQSK